MAEKTRSVPSPAHYDDAPQAFEDALETLGMALVNLVNVAMETGTKDDDLCGQCLRRTFAARLLQEGVVRGTVAGMSAAELIRDFGTMVSLAQFGQDNPEAVRAAMPEDVRARVRAELEDPAPAAEKLKVH